MTEAELDAEIRRLCRRLGVSRLHVPDSRRSLAGFPDLILWRGRVIFRELKSERGRCSRRQLAVMRSLENAFADVAVWRPVDLENGRIEAELRSLG